MGVLSAIKTSVGKHSASHTATHIVPRKVKFDWSHTPLEWIPGSPFASHFINEINTILPAGEFWFCRLYNKALPLITDDKLREDVQMFIRQEAMHARAHGSAIAEYLQSHNIDTERNTKIMDWLFDEALADAPLGVNVPKFLEKRWLIIRLGLIATIEHMTCVLGNYVLENKAWDKAGADPVLLDLLRWHGAEEVEHRSVAFDLYQHLGGDYLSRYYLSLVAVPMILGLWVDGAAHIMSQDEQYKSKKPSVFKPWVWLQWAKESKTGHLPHPLWLIAQQVSYFSPWYNPVTEGSTEDALAYLATSPAAKRATEMAAKPVAEAVAAS
ncbi:metal-dependent hydrolase [Aquirhabdus parva]|uniref:Metal-dependent hydrolase n=1 Tax=Aquirhabdus parva TaxID=2283318 RepID=A0A345P568_9GAMM|nr:metal-dependent hydrolase [Aquirhabdus parva]AXI02427.1 metal-dependent hydrolase [Aquirhabdus parva]